jgi:23S rRNA (cytosine1962-C5)-methyltransferase
LITSEEVAALAAGQTNAHRLWTGADGWVERFGYDYLVSAVDDGVAIAAQLPGWISQLGLPAGRVFARRLVKQPGEDDKPVQLSGAEGDAKTVVFERGLKFGIDFEAGYSAGLFCDQRMNRAHLESFRPQRVLNCFSYTCAFSVAAARAGAATLSLDLSRKSLDRGRENFLLNGFAGDPHRFIADDVFAVLPRLARRGEKFDTIILDPPTFSRNAKGKVFRVEKDFEMLLELALDVAEPGAWILLSTNARELDAEALTRLAGGLRCREIAPPSEYPPGAAAATLWVSAP